MDEEDVRRDERIRQDEARKQEFKGCLKVVLVILIASLAMGVCGAIFCVPGDTRSPSPQRRPTMTPGDYFAPRPYATTRAVATARAPTRVPTRTPTQDLTRVEACAQVWEYIYYVAEGFEIDGLSPQDALDTAVVGVMEAHNLTTDDMNSCLDVLEAAGY